MATQVNARPQRTAAPALIREPNVQVGGSSVSLLMLIPAALASALINGGLIFGLYLLNAPASAAPPSVAQLEDIVKGTETVVQADPPPEPESTDPLVITDVDPAAAEPDVNINFNVNRKEEVSIPGVVNPDEPVGILNASKDNPPTSLPAPFGLGSGQGGAAVGDLPGTGSNIGMAGGMSLRGMPLAGTFYGRSGATREKALREGGGTGATEAAVAGGLHWIVKQQNADGGWSLDGGKLRDRGNRNEIAGTAFGLLPLLGAGYTHKKAKNNKENPFDKPIEKGLLFLMRKQDRKSGNYGGGMYAHALATITMCEAYGLSQDPALRRSAQMGVNYLVNAQHSGGGWRYSPREKGDTSVTGWVVMALKSAQMANLDVPEQSMSRVARYLEDVCDKRSEGYGYVGPQATSTMSAVGLLCRQYVQSWGSQNLRLVTGVEKNIETKMPRSNFKNMYYYYYATQVMHHFGGDSWKKWNEQMRDLLLKAQEKTPLRGSSITLVSWSPDGDAHGAAGGRLMITSLSILCLEVYYRHLPLYYRDSGDRRLAAN
ncbi:MAG: terpene cyclase/mutase family protein [Gemmataceae bacterium]|nr:terpene cyclase/mutase family protein [Gemmataceae bacterium]